MVITATMSPDQGVSSVEHSLGKLSKCYWVARGYYFHLRLRCHVWDVAGHPYTSGMITSWNQFCLTVKTPFHMLLLPRRAKAFARHLYYPVALLRRLLPHCHTDPWVYQHVCVGVGM